MEAIEKAAVESLVYQGLTLKTVDREGKKNLSDLLGVADSDYNQPSDIPGPLSSFYQDVKYTKILKYKKNTKTYKYPITQNEKSSIIPNFAKDRLPYSDMSNHERSDTSPKETKESSKFSSFLKFGIKETPIQESDTDQKHINRVVRARQYQHKLKQNFYFDRNGSLKEKLNGICDESVKENEPFEILSHSNSLPIIPFSPNYITECDDSIEYDVSTAYNDNHDLSSGDINEDEDEQYSSMLFVTNGTSLENIIDVAKKELFDNDGGEESDESDCDSYASICFNNSWKYEDLHEKSVPDYLDMNKLRKRVRI
jgi:hypothetical protein